MATTSQQVVIGIDFGTLSGRASVVRVSDGQELGSAAFDYPHGVMDRRLLDDGPQLAPDWALQVPQDYVDVLSHAVPGALAAAGVDPGDVVGVGTDFTSCTMIPCTADLTPLCELPQFADRPHAYVKLWKHHASQSQGERINALARELEPALLTRYGGEISADWQLAKALAIFEEDREIYDAMDRWVEALDWIVWFLTGEYRPSVAAAGYKGNFQDGAYPARGFLAALNPGFASFAEDKLEPPTMRPGELAGKLRPEAAALMGLPEGIAVAAGNIDAHVTVPAADSVEPGIMTLIMGTSTCHMMSTVEFGEVPGVGGIVDGGIVTGLWGYEAGQAGVGDIFAWFAETSVPGAYYDEAAARGLTIHEYLTELAAGQAVGEHGLIALDWHSGNRSILDDTELSGMILGQTLTTTPQDQYRALMEATAFGTRVIIEAFESAGMTVGELVVAGGLIKNPLLMQIYSDVMGLPLSVAETQNSGALGSAIHAAVAAGCYPDVRSAAPVMGSRRTHAYTPIGDNVPAYDRLYGEYRKLHDYFGCGGNDVMHMLKRTRREIFAARSGGNS